MHTYLWARNIDFNLLLYIAIWYHILPDSYMYLFSICTNDLMSLQINMNLEMYLGASAQTIAWCAAIKIFARTKLMTKACLLIFSVLRS